MAPSAPATMAEGLIPLLTSLAQVKLAQDADIAFLNDIEAQIATKIRESQATELANQAGALSPSTPSGPPGGGADMLGNLIPGMAPGPSPMGAMGPMPGPMPGGPMGGMGGPGAGMPPAPPNADELRRTLSL